MVNSPKRQLADTKNELSDEITHTFRWYTQTFVGFRNVCIKYMLLSSWKGVAGDRQWIWYNCVWLNSPVRWLQFQRVDHLASWPATSLVVPLFGLVYTGQKAVCQHGGNALAAMVTCFQLFDVILCGLFTAALLRVFFTVWKFQQFPSKSARYAIVEIKHVIKNTHRWVCN